MENPPLTQTDLKIVSTLQTMKEIAAQPVNSSSYSSMSSAITLITEVVSTDTDTLTDECRERISSVLSDIQSNASLDQYFRQTFDAGWARILGIVEGKARSASPLLNPVESSEGRYTRPVQSNLEQVHREKRVRAATLLSRRMTKNGIRNHTIEVENDPPLNGPHPIDAQDCWDVAFSQDFNPADQGIQSLNIRLASANSLELAITALQDLSRQVRKEQYDRGACWRMLTRICILKEIPENDRKQLYAILPSPSKEEIAYVNTQKKAAIRREMQEMESAAVETEPTES